MRKWKIIGANRETGQDVVVMVDALSEKHAGIAASELGIAVSSAHRMPSALMRTVLQLLPLLIASLAMAIAVYAYLFTGPPGYGSHPKTPEGFARAEFDRAIAGIKWTGDPAWSMAGGDKFVGLSAASESFRVAEVITAGDYIAVLYDFKITDGLNKDYTILKNIDGKLWKAPSQYVSEYTDDPFPGAPPAEAAAMQKKISDWDD